MDTITMVFIFLFLVILIVAGLVVVVISSVGNAAGETCQDISDYQCGQLFGC